MYDREALLAAVDLPELADELLGTHVGSARSPLWRCPNPGHVQTGRTPPLSIFFSHRGEQRWRCHGCGEGGSAIDLVLVCRSCTMRDALDFLADRAARDVRVRRTSAPSDRAGRARPAPRCTDPEGMQRYVDDCASRLWKPEARAIRRWLTHRRGIPADVLEVNHIGVDLGPRVQDRPAGMPRAMGAVLPVVVQDQAVYAQVRVPHPGPDRPKYLNPAATLAPNPRVTRIRPCVRHHAEVVVTEGTIDALSAAAAGYRAVGVLSAAYGDEAVAVALARLPEPLVLALDADDAGRTATARLSALLQAKDRNPIQIDLGSGDLNDAMRRSDDWSARLEAAIEGSIASGSAARATVER